MVVRKRVLQASPEMVKRLKQIQGKIKSTNGDEPSLTELTNMIIRQPAFEDVEKQILKRDRDLDLNVKLD